MALLGLLALCAAPSWAGSLNDTGQVDCFNASAKTGTVSAATPHPIDSGFARQDCTQGRAAADAMRQLTKVGASTSLGRDYTKIANNGSELPASATLGAAANDWACTRDNVTGLIWEVKTGSGLRSVGNTYSWYETNGAINGGNEGYIGSASSCNSTLTNCNTTAYRNAVNAARLCGATDWRLPTRKELQSLMDYSNGTIDDYFPNTVASSYWTGETYAAGVLYAWSFSLSSGVNGSLKSFSSRVRLVRGGQ